MGQCMSRRRKEREGWNNDRSGGAEGGEGDSSERNCDGCLAMAKEKKSRFYIARRCIVMLLCWLTYLRVSKLAIVFIAFQLLVSTLPWLESGHLATAFILIMGLFNHSLSATLCSLLYFDVGCQSSAYIISIAGWALGIKLGSESSGVQYDGHRNIGILLFCLGTLQVFALLLRPRSDHKYRLFWNIYHHSVGYLVILLSIINIFKGFNILDPEKKWKSAYIVIISIMVFLVVCLEAYTWFIVIKRKKLESEGKNPQVVNGGANRVNGYGVREQSGAI